MQDHTTTTPSFRLALAACCLFIVLSALVIPFVGIQTDEALFSSPLYQYIGKHLSFRIRHLPFMVMTYLGSFKTLLYWPIFGLFGTGVWPLRLPMVCLGAVTVFFFYRLSSSAGGLAASIGVFLLATDPVFVLTNAVDWGPVAIEHVLLVTGCWALVRSGASRRPERLLFLGFFCFGLALWNKAIFLWALSGITVAGLLVFWREIRARLNSKNLGLAAAAFFLGAAPLVVYNLTGATDVSEFVRTLRAGHLTVPGRESSSTFRNNFRPDTVSFSRKWHQVKIAMNGDALFAYMVGEDYYPHPKAPATLSGRAALWIREHVGERRETGFYYVFLAVFLGAPWWWRSRAARFSLVFLTIAWLEMALTQDAGASAHHVVLLWPFPILFVAVALASLPWRPLAILIAIGMVAMNLLVDNQYIYQFARNGPTGIYTDAIVPLSDSLANQTAQHVYVTDWGIFDAVNLLRQGHLDMHLASATLTADAPNEEQQREITGMVLDPAGLFVGHVPEQEVFPKVGAHLDQAAQALGYRKDLLRIVPDSNGRPVFEVFRLVRDTPIK